MSSTFEQWSQAKKRRDRAAYFIAKSYANETQVRPADLATFKAAEAEMVALEAQFSEES